MSAFYTELAADAAAAIKELGRPIVFKRYTNVTNVAAGTVSRVVAKQTTLPVAIVPASSGTLEAFDVRFMSDVDAKSDVRFGLASVLDVDGVLPDWRPEPNDEAEFDGRTWLVMGNTPLNVDGTDVVHSIGFRGT